MQRPPFILQRNNERVGKIFLADRCFLWLILIFQLIFIDNAVLFCYND